MKGWARHLAGPGLGWAEQPLPEIRPRSPGAQDFPLITLFLLVSPVGSVMSPFTKDTHRHQPVRRGPQRWHAALPGSLAPASATQEYSWPKSGPRRPRCGVPDPPDEPSTRNRQKRFVLSGGRWEKTDLTYRILRFPWQLVQEQVRQTVAEALQVWSKVTPLTFTEVHEGRADIMIDFTRYWHGDNLPFDGPGGILAHAFFPKTHREGDVHFDYDETWTVGDNQGTDLLQVAAHEFGHVLGLQHTTAAKALMSPFYTFRYPPSLSPDDRRGIQHLYGQPWSTPASSAPAPGPQAGVDTNDIAPLEPEAPPDACEASFDAASTIRGELFFFKGDFVWRLRGGQLQPGYPALASHHWQGLPSPVDAAFEDAQGHIWFFQGTQYWVYNGEKPVLGPAPLSDLGLVGSPVHAALVWGPEKNKIYFFHGGDYWRFHSSTNRVDSPVPRRATDWRGVPSEIDAAFQDADGAWGGHLAVVGALRLSQGAFISGPCSNTFPSSETKAKEVPGLAWSLSHNGKIVNTAHWAGRAPASRTS
ncbi:stromelysin-3 isoform X2 [Loxodonta africana]|uniref:stromelysin-3 isoform X2 n=1 Tax=Loxodonta africana TaxID=9785 RepID=UPI000C8142BF|nr:stromelysin-3 isoform X1 [Loxodonta africana]